MCYFVIGNMHRLRAELRDRGLLHRNDGGASVTVATVVRALQVTRLHLQMLRCVHAMLTRNKSANDIATRIIRLVVTIRWLGAAHILPPI